MDSCHPETGILADNEETMEKSILLPVPPHYNMTSSIFEVLVIIPILPPLQLLLYSVCTYHNSLLSVCSTLRSLSQLTGHRSKPLT